MYKNYIAPRKLNESIYSLFFFKGIEFHWHQLPKECIHYHYMALSIWGKFKGSQANSKVFFVLPSIHLCCGQLGELKHNDCTTSSITYDNNQSCVIIPIMNQHVPRIPALDTYNFTTTKIWFTSKCTKLEQFIKLIQFMVLIS
jgi:hypothetical protein